MPQFTFVLCFQELVFQIIFLSVARIVHLKVSNKFKSLLGCNFKNLPTQYHKQQTLPAHIQRYILVRYISFV